MKKPTKTTSKPKLGTVKTAGPPRKLTAMDRMRKGYYGKPG